VRTFCGQERRGFFRSGRPHFFVQILRIFRNLWCVRTDKGVEPVRIFCEQREGESIFRDFVRMSFMHDP